MKGTLGTDKSNIVTGITGLIKFEASGGDVPLFEAGVSSVLVSLNQSYDEATSAIEPTDLAAVPPLRPPHTLLGGNLPMFAPSRVDEFKVGEKDAIVALFAGVEY